MLTCGPPSLSSATPKAKGEDGESCSEDDSSEDEDPTVSIIYHNLEGFYIPGLSFGSQQKHVVT